MIKQILITIKRNIKATLARIKLKNIILKHYKSNHPMRVIVGSGADQIPGWISTDFPVFDITNERHWKFFFKKASIDLILGEHVLEHLCFNEIKVALKNVNAFLSPGGRFRIAVPDANHPSKYVYNLTKPGGQEPGADDHKIFFDMEIASRFAKMLNFDIIFVEFFDGEGYLQSHPFEEDYGIIKRSATNYKGRFTNDKDEYDQLLASTPEHLRAQFLDKNFSYTSLIFDLIKK